MMELIKDLLGFLVERKKLWMAPIILVLLLFGSLIVLTEGSAVAPFHLHAILRPALIPRIRDAPADLELLGRKGSHSMIGRSDRKVL